jgi:hypothetical protein
MVYHTKSLIYQLEGAPREGAQRLEMGGGEK